MKQGKNPPTDKTKDPEDQENPDFIGFCIKKKIYTDKAMQKLKKEVKIGVKTRQKQGVCNIGTIYQKL